jgi:ribose/xylose/arabinose/galactoside ABC-type transport system permease subunit
VAASGYVLDSTLLIIAGTLVGLLNGLIIAKRKINDFIVKSIFIFQFFLF